MPSQPQRWEVKNGKAKAPAPGIPVVVPNPTTPNHAVITVELEPYGESVEAVLFPMFGWVLPNDGDAVMVLIPDGDRTCGNSVAIPIPSATEAGLTSTSAMMKYLYGFMMIMYTVVAGGVPSPMDPVMAALQVALKAWFATMGGAAPVFPMPFPDSLLNALIVNPPTP